MNPKNTSVPNHVGIILDGNRRWAQEKGLSANEGHTQGLENLRTIVKYSLEIGIQYLSVFIFSTENWSRTKDEVGYLMKLVDKAMSKYLDEFHKEGAKIIVVGSKENVPSNILNTLQKAETKTSKNTRATLALCFNYGGQQEIADAVKAIINNNLSQDDITPELINKYLYQPNLPPVDLMIRTSGEIRTSGFMLWRAAYAELYFTDKYWPDFSPEDLDKALEEYAKRQRRFGS